MPHKFIECENYAKFLIANCNMTEHVTVNTLFFSNLLQLKYSLPQGNLRNPLVSLHLRAAIELSVEGGSSRATNRALLLLFCSLVPRSEFRACRFIEVMPPFSSVMAFLNDWRLSLTPCSFRTRVSFLSERQLRQKNS